ncbi:MAG: hypothetical protein WCK51_08900 [Armatimonadota bacterium]
MDLSREARDADEPCGSGVSNWREKFDRSGEAGAVIVAETNIIEFSFSEGIQVTVQWEKVRDGTQLVLNKIHDIADLDRLRKNVLHLLSRMDILSHQPQSIVRARS